MIFSASMLSVPVLTAMFDADGRNDSLVSDLFSNKLDEKIMVVLGHVEL